MGTRFSFWSVWVKFLWNVGLTVCLWGLPILEMSPGKPRAIFFLIKHWFWSTFNICSDRVRSSPSCGNRARSIIARWPSSRQWHLRLEPSSCSLHCSFLLCITTTFAKFLIIMVQTLPSPLKPLFRFPNWIIILTDSASLRLSLSEITATQLSSESYFAS